MYLVCFEIERKESLAKNYIVAVLVAPIKFGFFSSEEIATISELGNKQFLVKHQRGIM